MNLFETYPILQYAALGILVALLFGFVIGLGDNVGDNFNKEDDE